MNKIAQYLNQHIVGNVFDRLSIRDAYANDRSIVKNVPRLVTVPKTTDDIRKLCRFSSQLAKRNLRLPITVRGNGNDKTGAAVGDGLIISTEKLNNIQEIDSRGRLIRVQSGVTIGQINSALKLYGLTLPIDADPSETIGGLIANNYRDGYSGKYGGIYNYVDRAEIVLANGDIIQTNTLSRHALRKKQNEDTFEGEIYRKMSRLLKEKHNLAPKNLKTINYAGYSTAFLVEHNNMFNLMPLFLSSQGTLGIISEVILRLEVLQPVTGRLLINFKTIRPAIKFMHFANSLKPLSLNIYDNRIFATATKNGKKLPIFTSKLDNGYSVLVEFNNKSSRTKRNIKKCLKNLPDNIHVVVEDRNNKTSFRELHSALVSYLNDGIRGERPPILDDTFLPDDQLPYFLAELAELEEKLETPLPIFGSFATSNYSVRPEIHLDQVSGRQLALKFIKEYSLLVAKYKGSLTGGGPEGCVKALAFKIPPNHHAFYTDIKKLFDPENILNPEIKLGASVKPTIRHLRTHYNYRITTK